MRAARRPRSWRRWQILLPAGTVLLTAVLLLGLRWSGVLGKRSPAGLPDQSVIVAAVPIPHFEKAAPERRRFGRLVWRGGLILTSTSPFFGGWSGLAMDQHRFLAVSDTGVWLTARPTYEGGRPTGLVGARLGALRASGGQPLQRSRDRDAEGLALIGGSLERGEVVIGFERNHRVWRFGVGASGLGPSLGPVALPPGARRLAFNRSFEAICTLQSGAAAGAIVVLAERLLDAQGNLSGWLHPAAGAKAAGAVATGGWRPLSVRAIDGYDITDCAGVPDGGIVLLERRFRPIYGDPVTGAKMRLRFISETELLAGEAAAGEILLEADRRHEIDNMEGVAAHADPDGRTILTLISDDNFNRYMQRTVLVQFVLEDGNSQLQHRAGSAGVENDETERSSR